MSNHQFAICIRNEGNEASLERSKVYEVLVDDDAAGHDMLRVIDESGEDYLYPRAWFAMIELPLEAEQAVLQAAASAG